MDDIVTTPEQAYSAYLATIPTATAEAIRKKFTKLDNGARYSNEWMYHHIELSTYLWMLQKIKPPPTRLRRTFTKFISLISAGAYAP